MAALVPMVAEAWSLLDVHAIKATLPRFTAAIEAIVHQYGRASAAAALEFYGRQRRAAGVAGRPRLKMPPAVERSVVEAVTRSAVGPLYGQDAPEGRLAAHRALVSSVQDLVLGQSRNAIIGNVSTDREAKRWARVPEPTACSFCIMLATRGAVYRSKESADFRAHTVKPDGSGGTCQCHVEPVFNAYEPSARIREWSALYFHLADQFKGRDLQIAFRQAIEGRPVTGPVADLPKRAPALV